MSREANMNPIHANTEDAPEAGRGWMRILLAVDGSDCSDWAVEAVATRRWPRGTCVRVLSVARPVAPHAAVQWEEAGLPEGPERVPLTQAEEVAKEAAERLRPMGLRTDSVVRKGNPRSVIVDEAEDWDADLIVVGSHGYHGLLRWLMGGVAQSVVSHAHCSVEVVREKGRLAA